MTRSLLLAAALLLTACAGGGRLRGGPAERAARAALEQVGRPYRFGGADPRGFDCSGLVHYSYKQAGRTLPRSTELLYETGKKVSSSRLREGDLVFFDENGKKASHVGLYIGGGEFVHAPSAGKKVRRERLSDAYWRKRFRGARRPI